METKIRSKMRKDNFTLLVAAAAMLAACTSNDSFKEIVDDNETVMIGFETFHEKSTRATATGEISAPTDFTSAHGGFGVWGFKGAPADIVPASGTPSYVNITSSEGHPITTIFNNVKVWYADNTNDETYGDPEVTHYHFTYGIPKYWDKASEYTFFAYAPYDASASTGTTNDELAAATTVYLDQTKGQITVKAIPSIQDISTSNSSSSPAADDLVFTGTNDAAATDYLMATYAAEQKYNGTNQQTLHPSPSYTDVSQTVGFTFGHMLSRLQVRVMPKEQYAGVQSLDVNYLALTNMPTRAASTVTTVFTQTSPTAAAGTYVPNAYTTTLQVINSDGSTNTYATAQQSLYVLKDGTYHTTDGEKFVADNEKPSSQTQQFNYLIAPNTPASAYKLNIKYHITYVDGTTENVELSNLSLPNTFTSMAQNNSYVLTIKIALNEIFFTVENVAAWTPVDLPDVIVDGPQS